jgi:hypothetical protein
MRFLVVIFVLMQFSSTAIPQVCFPLHVGDMWFYRDLGSVQCDGTSIIYLIVGDTVLHGQAYSRFLNYSAFSGPLVRADSIRVYEYDTATHTEYVLFDFSAKPGDTVSVRNNGAKVTIALGSMKFAVGTTTYTIRDSIGVISFYDAVSLCSFSLTGARIDGKQIYTGVLPTDKQIPEEPFLGQNYPNPFNPSTTIKFELPRASEVRLSVFDILGREVSVLVNERRDAGVHEVKFDGTGLASGAYFYRLQVGDFVQARKLMLVH